MTTKIFQIIRCSVSIWLQVWIIYSVSTSQSNDNFTDYCYLLSDVKYTKSATSTKIWENIVIECLWIHCEEYLVSIVYLPDAEDDFTEMLNIEITTIQTKLRRTKVSHTYGQWIYRKDMIWIAINSFNIYWCRSFSYHQSVTWHFR